MNPQISRMRSERFPRLSYGPVFNLDGAGRVRTDDLLRARQALLPAELQPHMVPTDGIEPSTLPSQRSGMPVTYAGLFSF